VLNQAGQATGLPGTDPAGAGAANWELEEALDVEWAHAIAPGAQIVLVEASSQALSDLMASVATAASQPGVSVVSMSWGFTEGVDVLSTEEALYDSTFTTPGVTFVASTGDYATADPEYPAFSPNVVAVGGTSLTLNANNSYHSETGWGAASAAAGTVVGSGGGVSQYEAEPSYQLGVQATGYRTTPDVAFVADPATGAWIADPYNLPASSPFEVVGGTSLSAPASAGLLALVNQGRVAAGKSVLDSASPTEAHQDVYSLSQADFNVISSGTNGGYNAAPGYNLVTGLGTPVANLLVPDMVAGNFPATGRVAAISSTLNANPGFSGSGGGGSGSPMNVFDVMALVPGRGPALGQDESQVASPVTYQTLTSGAAVHSLTAADLQMPYGEGAADPQRAALPGVAAGSSSVGDVPLASSGAAPGLPSAVLASWLLPAVAPANTDQELAVGLPSQGPVREGTTLPGWVQAASDGLFTVGSDGAAPDGMTDPATAASDSNGRCQHQQRIIDGSAPHAS
jgi:hypothetical protein